MTARCCGFRIEGGIYMELGLVAGGAPVENFLLDPPCPLEMDVAPQGISWIQRDGVWHMVDWIGESYYPNIADFVEEVRRMGLSRRIPANEDFSRISEQSRVLCVHGRAIIEEVSEYRRSSQSPYACPKRMPQHESVSIEETCAGIWWEDLTNIEAEDIDNETGLATRKLPSFSYMGKARKQDFTPTTEPGFFASFPLSRLVIINKPDDPEGIEKLKEKTSAAGLATILVDE